MKSCRGRALDFCRDGCFYLKIPEETASPNQPSSKTSACSALDYSAANCTTVGQEVKASGGLRMNRVAAERCRHASHDVAILSYNAASKTAFSLARGEVETEPVMD